MNTKFLSCPTCRHSNSPLNYYCVQCGTVLVCPRCRTVLLDSLNFCGNCGQQLAQNSQGVVYPEPQEVQRNVADFQQQAPLVCEESVPARKTHSLIPPEMKAKLETARTQQTMAGERRVVTMLFCDVKGSTAAAESLDPEDWAEIMNGIFEYMIRPVYHYEGAVARLMGDAILAFFGAPIAHEDDPQRAVLAGLDIVNGVVDYKSEVKRKWGIDFDLRVGINTGLVMVGIVGSDLQVEYTALGDEINLASRMEQTAYAGTVQISENTYKFVAPFFEVKDLGRIEVKGKAEPVQVFQVLKQKSVPGSQRGFEGMELPLVGREKEWDALLSAFKGLEKGIGQIVFLTGEAGLGKSRLIQELKRKNVGNGYNWFETSSLSFETHQPYGLFLRLGFKIIGATVNDSKDILQSRLDAFLDNQTESDRKLHWSLFSTLFDLEIPGVDPLEGDEFKKVFYAFNQQYWRSIALDKPTIVVLDDLHWSDPASGDLLADLFSLTEQVPLMLVCATRPDREGVGWRLKLSAENEYPHRLTHIQLQPLTENQSNLLVDQLLNLPDFPANLRSKILEKSEGNPFFVEEVVRTLIDQGIVVQKEPGGQWGVNSGGEGIRIPESLNALLMARMDRLDDESRRVMQVASVVGRSFYYRLLEAIFDHQQNLKTSLRNLQQRTLIEELTRIPELEFMFRHTLTQEAAYNSILFKQRRAYHLRVAEALEALYSDRLLEFSPILAHHYAEGGEKGKALVYFVQAGDSALKKFATLEAISHYSNALGLVDQDEAVQDNQQLVHIYVQHGRALELNSNYEEAIENYHAMKATAVRLGDRKMELMALLQEGTIRSTANTFQDLDLGEKLAKEALKLAEGLNDETAEARINWNLMNIYRFSAQFDKARHHGDLAQRLARQQNMTELLGFISNDMAHIFFSLWEKDLIEENLNEANRIWRELGNKPMLADNLSTTVLLNMAVGEYDLALRNSKEAYEISLSIGNIWGQSYSFLLVGMVHWERGDPGKAIECFQKGITLGKQGDFLVAQVFCRAYLSQILVRLGNLEEALTIANLALEIAAEKIPRFILPAYAALWEINILRGDREAADENKKPLEENLKETMRFGYPFYIPVLTQDYIQKNDPQGLVDALEDLSFILKSPLLRGVAHQVNYCLAWVAMELGEWEEAGEKLKLAREHAEMLGSRWLLWQILARQAELQAKDGDLESARRNLAEAKRIVEGIAANIPDPGLKESFLGTKIIRELMETRLLT